MRIRFLSPHILSCITLTCPTQRWPSVPYVVATFQEIDIKKVPLRLSIEVTLSSDVVLVTQGCSLVKQLINGSVLCSNTLTLSPLHGESLKQPVLSLQ